MNITGKTVLVIGMARSGVAAAKKLDRLGAKVIVSDNKPMEQLLSTFEEFGDNNHIRFELGLSPESFILEADIIVISPGVSIEMPYIQFAKDRGIEVLSEVELAYRFCTAPIIAITGTNGKTTTTALTGEIFKASGRGTWVVGNIGIPFMGCVQEIAPKDIVVAEISSFQLEAIIHFKPRVSAVLNITEDHLNRHRTMQNYIAMKARIFENTDSNDVLILNADDKTVANLAQDTKADVLFFSRKKVLDRGAWVEDGSVMVRIDGPVHRVCPVESIAMPGLHSLENALAATLMAACEGVEMPIIAKTLSIFPGVEHRIERVAKIDGVVYYNDSKGTNPDASIKAIEAMKGPTVLIAGGMDKHNHFDEFIDAFKDTVTNLVVLGETADLLERTAYEKGFYKVQKTNSMEEAVIKANELASPGGNVLLSPACASWDMFSDYEERGRIFKEAVKKLRR